MPYITKRRLRAAYTDGRNGVGHTVTDGTTRQDGYDDWWDTEGPSQITIHEDDEPEYTGLLDADGNELVRVRNRIPMGFRK